MQVLFYPLRNGRFAERNSAEYFVKLGSGKSEFFFIDLTKATPELLDEDNRGFGRAKHNYLVDLGKVDALVKDINGKYVIELIFGSIVYKSCAHFFASTLIVFSG